MITLLKYLFAYIYNYYKNSVRYREAIFIYPSFIISILIVSNLAVIVSILLYLFNKQSVILWTNYFLIVSFLIVCITIFYLRINKKYLKVLEYVESFSDEKKKRIKVLSLIYVILSILFYIALVIYNISNVDF
jgi:hypothetical protein